MRGLHQNALCFLLGALSATVPLTLYHHQDLAQQVSAGLAQRKDTLTLEAQMACASLADGHAADYCNYVIDSGLLAQQGLPGTPSGYAPKLMHATAKLPAMLRAPQGGDGSSWPEQLYRTVRAQRETAFP